MALTAKTKMAGINLLISQLLISIFLLIVWAIWFPSPFSEILGFSKAAQIMVLVNICLGPLLIFIIYKEGKKYLKLDLTILAILQIAALLFGAYSIYLKHPVYTVFAVDRFTLINVNRATPEKVKYPLLKRSFFSSPKTVYAKRPENPDDRNKLLFSVLFNGEPDLDRRAEHYEPFEKHLEKVFKRSLDTKILFPDDVSKLKLSHFLNKHGGEAKDYGFFPLQGSTDKDVIWVLDRINGKPVGTIDSDPWQVADKQQ